MFMGHVAQHWEDGKTWEETGDAVYGAGQDGIPARAQYITGLHQFEFTSWVSDCSLYHIYNVYKSISASAAIND